ncbi:methyltransferase domain-containing protein [Thalassotalea psychrophila]|uniref:Methyltransferase domain-containing protein n=1 Tax=Thalassotalea psychrophila TaxID=3065647 RepID=A0ABY9TTX0_9GAMM|nr:methyltransferase domain-containing protein [Colwelliaceae bacterium SQ149]
MATQVSTLLICFFDIKAKFVDYAGGYGVFVRMMRDIGFDYYWDDKYTSNLFAKGFEANKNQQVEVVTSFESLEHFVDPLSEIEKMLTISNTIMFSTELIPESKSPDPKWWYLGLDHGQHISFYKTETLDFIATKYTLHYQKFMGIHILSKQQLSPIKLFIAKILIKLKLNTLLLKSVNSKTISDFNLLSR